MPAALERGGRIYKNVSRSRTRHRPHHHRRGCSARAGLLAKALAVSASAGIRAARWSISLFYFCFLLIAPSISICVPRTHAKLSARAVRGMRSTIPLNNQKDPPPIIMTALQKTENFTVTVKLNLTGYKEQFII